MNSSEHTPEAPPPSSRLHPDFVAELNVASELVYLRNATRRIVERALNAYGTEQIDAPELADALREIREIIDPGKEPR